MDTSVFNQLFSSAHGVKSDPSEMIESIRISLDASPIPLAFYDISGNGTEYLCSGARGGVGFVDCRISLLQDSTAVIRTTPIPVPAEIESRLSKLCRIWNKTLFLEGLTVRDGFMFFESGPFPICECLFPWMAGSSIDSLDDRSFIDIPRRVAFALETIRRYTFAILALEAGVDPRDLLSANMDEQGEAEGGTRIKT